MKHPFNQQACLDRLKGEYDKYGKLIVAFDNTIYDFHNNGGDYSEVIELLKECIKLEFDLILFTDSDKVSDKVRWLVYGTTRVPISLLILVQYLADPENPIIIFCLMDWKKVITF